MPIVTFVMFFIFREKIMNICSASYYHITCISITPVKFVVSESYTLGDKKSKVPYEKSASRFRGKETSILRKKLSIYPK